MVQGPSWEANWFAASQEIPLISRNPKVHYRTHKRPPPVPILGQPNPVHIPTSHLLEIHPDINHPSTPRSPQWFFPSDFPTKTLFASAIKGREICWLIERPPVSISELLKELHKPDKEVSMDVSHRPYIKFTHYQLNRM